MCSSIYISLSIHIYIYTYIHTHKHIHTYLHISVRAHASGGSRSGGSATAPKCIHQNMLEKKENEKRTYLLNPISTKPPLREVYFKVLL